MTREEILAAIKRCAEKLGRPPRLREIRSEINVTSRQIRQEFGGWVRALRVCGMERRGSGCPAPMKDLFKDWAELVRTLGKIPAAADYNLHSNFSIRPLIKRCGAWRRVPATMQAYMVREGIEDQYRDVMNVIARHHERLMKADRKCTPRSSGPWKAHLREDRPVYGAPLLPTALTYEPVSEGGVIFLFALLAKELGFAVTTIQPEFPDCEALCRVDEGKWQKVRIEFEYASKNFVHHMHDTDGCDMIVCWVHDWPECRLDVIELRSEMSRLLAGDSENH